MKRFTSIVFIGFTLVVFLVLFYGCPYHLLHKEQISLFLYTCESFLVYGDKPALLACLCGDFLTQFFCFRMVGPLVIAGITTGIALCFYWILGKLWGQKRLWLFFALLVGGVEALRACQLIYPLSSSVSLLLGEVLFLLYQGLKSKNGQKWMGLLIGTIGYIFIGYGIFVFLLFLLLELGKEKDWKEKAYVLGLSLLIAFIPLLGRDAYLLTGKQVYFYPAIAEETGYDVPLYERLLKLDWESAAGNWKEVRKILPKESVLSLDSYYYNMAWAAEGQLPEKLLAYHQPGLEGLFIPIDASSSYLTALWSGELWFRLGDMTMAEPAYLLSMIFTPQYKGRRMIQRLAEIHLIHGDTEAAKKYLRILSQTLFYREWANERMSEHLTPDVESWLQERRRWLPTTDTIRISTMDVVKSLRTLVKSCPENTLAYDYLLCFHLLSKDIDSFIQDYRPVAGKAPKRLYAEALLIDLFRKKASAQEIQHLIVDPDIMLDFKAYNQLAKENPTLLARRFGKTYWYYYQFIKTNN